MPLFRIYYDPDNDIKTFDGDPYDAPFFGALAIVQKNNAHGRYVTSNFDYYVWKPDLQEWMGCDHIGLIDYLSRKGYRKVICGRMVEKEKFYRIVKMANEDPDFPKRTGWQKEEVRY